MTEYKAGQRVKVEFEAKIESVDDRTIQVSTDDNYFYYFSPRIEPAIRITPVAPASWPPQVGDIWGVGGEEYYVREEVESYSRIVIAAFSGGKDYFWSTCLDDFKALNPALVRRRGQ
jgi:hypothetical protein